jgi:hypothetical protein
MKAEGSASDSKALELFGFDVVVRIFAGDVAAGVDSLTNQLIQSLNEEVECLGHLWITALRLGRLGFQLSEFLVTAACPVTLTCCDCISDADRRQ